MAGSHDDNLKASASPAGGSNWGHFVAPSVEELNELMPQFEVLELIGQGGMGAVYKAVQTKLDRIVAVKLLPPFEDDNESHFAERFEREARAMARLNHPNIVTVHDFGETERDHSFFIMEYVDGSDLHTLIQGGQLTTKHALGWMPFICSAIRYAHEKGVIHRDIKPANVLISREGEVKVGDFGLAKLVGQSYDRSITQTQVSMGTPDYAAPEALDRGATVDHRADIYSLGVLFYEMLTGKVPRGAWKAPSSMKDVDVRLDKIIIKAMQPDPDQRYQSVSQIEDAIGQLRNVPKLVAPRPAKKDPAPAAVAAETPSQGTVVPLPSESQKSVKITRSSTTSRPRKPRDKSNPLVVAAIAIASISILMLILVGVLNHSKSKKPTDLGPETPVVETPVTDPPTTVPPGDDPENSIPGTTPERPQFLAAPSASDGWVNVLAQANDEMVRESEGWTRVSEDRLLVRDARGPAFLQFPQTVASSFEVEYTIQRTRKPGPTAFLLPLQDTAVALVIGNRPGPGGEPYLCLAEVDNKGALDPRNSTRSEIEMDPSTAHSVLVRVVSDASKDRLSILAQVDEQEVMRWIGSSKQLSLSDAWLGRRRPGKGNGKNLSTLGLVTQSDLALSGIRLRTLTASTPLDRPLKTTTPVPEDVTTDPVTPALATETLEPTMAEDSGVQLRIDAIRTKFAQQIQDQVEATYQADVNTLNGYYEGTLNGLLAKAETEEVKSLLQKELEALQAGIPFSVELPANLPVDLARNRQIYLEQLDKLETNRITALRPILEAEQQELIALRQELTVAEDLVSAAQVTTALDELQTRLDPIVAQLTPEEDPVLQLPEFPRKRPSVRGRVIAWQRDVTSLASPLLEIPSNLSSVAAIAGGTKVAVALRTDGTVAGWGGVFDGSLQDELDTLTDIAQVSVALDSKSLHIAALTEEGKLRSITRGWGDLADLAPTLTSAIPQPVDFVIGPMGGVALQANGQTALWGELDLPEEDVETISDSVKLLFRKDLLLSLDEEGSITKLGSLRKQMPADLNQAHGIYLGDQRDLGGVALLPTQKLYCFGTFAQYQEALDAEISGKTVEKVVAGFDAFAVMFPDESWAFFGAGIDTEGAADQADGCVDVVITQETIIGLKD